MIFTTPTDIMRRPASRLEKRTIWVAMDRLK